MKVSALIALLEPLRMSNGDDEREVYLQAPDGSIFTIAQVSSDYSDVTCTIDAGEVIE